MRAYATVADRSLVNAPSTSTATYRYASNWDADMIYGCSCDSGYEGWNCMSRRCPKGDDSMTTGQADEVQLLRCDLSPTAGGGAPRFTLSFRGATTRPFGPGISWVALRDLLTDLPTVGSVSVTYSAGSTFCDDTYTSVASPTVPASGNIVSVAFLTEHGDVPTLVVLDAKGKPLGVDSNFVFVAVDGDSLTYTTSASPSTATAASATGTKEDAPCSGRGRCDTGTGVCTCYTGYASSNGQGGQGTNGDCGWPALPITSCPGVGVECSGHGTCSKFPEYKCSCYAGWGGGDCAERLCPQGPAWFSYPTADDTAHSLAECSNKGRCNRRTGQCECQIMFEGAACERMTCPGKTSPLGVCSGHGRCLSMASLAAYATDNGDATPFTYGLDPNNPATWDASKVFGCLCDDGYTGYDCSQRTCPLGNDITLQEWDASAVGESQTLVCTLLPGAANPTFKLQFREAQTAPLPTTATAADIEEALEQLETIGDVDVQFTTGAGTPACTPTGLSGPPVMTFTFITQHGDVPPLRVVMDDASRNADGTFNGGDGWSDTDLEWTGGDPADGYVSAYTYQRVPTYPSGGVRAREVRKGRSGNAECSGRGICDRETGVCKCFTGFGASNGNRQAGAVEDCGWREPYVPIRK